MSRRNRLRKNSKRCHTARSEESLFIYVKRNKERFFASLRMTKSKHLFCSLQNRDSRRLHFQNPGGRSPATPKARSSARPARPSVPSSNSLPINVTPCGTRRGGLNVGSGLLGSGAQSLRALETCT